MNFQTIVSTKKNLIHLLTENEISVPAMAADQLWEYYSLLQENNQDRDLSRLNHPGEIFYKHFLDCALVLKFIPSLPSPLLDIGTGAGFPGIILKILSPQTEIILGEVRKKRCLFLEKTIEKLNLSNIEVFPHRIGPRFPLPISGAISRAFASIPDTLRRVSHFLPINGSVIFMKGPEAKTEKKMASEIFQNEYTLQKFWNYSLGDSGHKRGIYIYKRLKEILPMTEEKSNPKTLNTKLYTNTEEIISPANARFKSLKILMTSRGIHKEKQFTLPGNKLVTEFLQRKKSPPTISSNPWPEIVSLIATPHLWQEQTHIRNLTMDLKIPVILLHQKLWPEIDLLNTQSPMLLLRLPEHTHWSGKIIANGIHLFLPLQDPGNLGTAIRSAAAFGVTEIILLKEAASPYHPKALRASANALFQVRITYGPTFAEIMQMPELPLAILSQTGEDISKIAEHSSLGLVVGMEGPGFRMVQINQQVRRFAIPMSPEIESLNSATALAIALFTYNNKFKQ